MKAVAERSAWKVLLTMKIGGEMKSLRRCSGTIWKQVKDR